VADRGAGVPLRAGDVEGRAVPAARGPGEQVADVADARAGGEPVVDIALAAAGQGCAAFVEPAEESGSCFDCVPGAGSSPGNPAAAALRSGSG
jgi:hypothetical protein